MKRVRVKIVSDGTRAGTSIHNLTEPGEPIVTCADGHAQFVRAIDWRIREDGEPACFLYYAVRVDADVELVGAAQGIAGDVKPRLTAQGRECGAPAR